MTKTKLTKIERQAFSAIGRIGGIASMKKRGRKGRIELGKKAAQARWAKTKKPVDK